MPNACEARTGVKTLAHAADRQDILIRISNLSITDRPKWGRMTAGEMVCHLSDSYRVGLGEKTASAATGILHRTVLKWIALRVPIKWMKGYGTRPELEQGKGGSPPVDFNRDREFLASTLNRFCDDLPHTPDPHPILGSMSRQEWWRWGYLHADHHLRQFGR